MSAEPNRDRHAGEKAFLPNKLGRFELEAPILKVSVELGRPRRGIFGERRGQVEQFHVYGEPLTIEVLPIPEEGRPSPYFGAVGRFQLTSSHQSCGSQRCCLRNANGLECEISIHGLGTRYTRTPIRTTIVAVPPILQSVNRPSPVRRITRSLQPAGGVEAG